MTADPLVLAHGEARALVAPLGAEARAWSVGGVELLWPGDPARVTELGPLGAASDKAYKTRRFGRAVRCHYTFMHENLMDMKPSVPAPPDHRQGRAALSR